MEIHGVKLFFRRERACPEPEPYDRASCGKAPAKAQESDKEQGCAKPTSAQVEAVELEATTQRTEIGRIHTSTRSVWISGSCRQRCHELAECKPA